MGAKGNTRIDALVPWDPQFDASSPMFEPLRHLLAPFRGHEEWPGLEVFQALLDDREEPIRSLHGAALKVVEQAGKPDHFGEHYVPRIFYDGEIQTRRRNWHDLFQLLSWFIFPRTKAVINATHIPFAQARIEGGGEVGRRSPVENTLSLFDEGGVVILSYDETLLQLIRDFRWKELFWGRRAELAGKLHCVTFGHAMYEKGLKPYIGMTANAILVPVTTDYFALPLLARLAHIDTTLAEIFSRGEQYRQPRDLQPFPILGLPGWDPANGVESYYDNTDYFRPGRGRRKA